MGIARALERLGLVDLTESERGALPDDPAVGMTAAEIAELARGPGAKPRTAPRPERAAASRSPAAPAGRKDTEANGVTDPALGVERPLEAIYAAAQVPASPFPADKLFRLLDGLKSLPEKTRKQAVLAMDAAEDAWAIEDSLIDAKRKIQVLQAEKVRVEEVDAKAAEKATRELAEREAYKERASEQIRQQIQDLEKLLEKELADNAEACEAIKRTAIDARRACEQAQRRFDAEIERLAELGRMFEADPEGGARA